MTNPNLQPIDEKCTDCGRYIQEGHIDCNCEKSHPEDPCGQTANLQPLRDLVAHLHDLGDYDAADRLTAALDRMESQSCDCTAGTPHVHTGGE